MRKSSISKLKFIVLLMTCFVMVTLGIFGSKFYQQVIDLGETWKQYSRHQTTISSDLSKITQDLGYNGMIHHFKNYILRQDQSALTAVKGNINSLRATIADYRHFDLSPEEIEALKQLETVVIEYGEKLSLAQSLFAQGTPATEVDHQVKVIDDPAVRALSTLMQGNQKRSVQQITSADFRLERIDQYMLIGAPLLPAVLLTGLIALFLLRKMSTFTDEIEAQREYLNNLLETVPSAIVIFTENGKIVRCNGQAAEMFGYKSKIFTQLAARELLADEPDIRLDGNTLEMTTELSDWVIGKVLNMNCRRSNQEIFPTEIKLAAIQGSCNLIASISDITKHRESEDLLSVARERAVAASQAKSEFLANMSHEIRTPMNAIIGLTHLSLQSSVDPKQIDYMQKVHKSAIQLLRIINEILDFSKIEAGKLEIEQRSFSLMEVLENLTNVIAQKSQEKSLAFLIHIDPDVPDNLIGDSLRVGQILLNLCSNAVKFTAKGSVELRILLEEATGENLTLHFIVKDSGIGISQEQLGNLFHSFTQADGSITRNYGGTGLGLVISKRLVELMDGRIWVESDPGQGSRFEFTANFSISVAPSVEATQHHSNWESLKTLVVEPDPLQREYLEETLRSFGLQPEMASSGQEAKMLLSQATPQNPYWLLITESDLPGQDELELIGWVREKLWPEPKIIVLTQTKLTATEVAVREVEHASFLPKPYGPSVLLNTIYKVLSDGWAPSVSATAVEQGTQSPCLLQGRLLLVEDNEINQQVASEMIGPTGLDVVIANNGLEAIEALKRQEFQLVLMDIEMPVLDGYEATKRIRTNPDWAELPIIAMTAHAMVGVKEKCESVGMNGYISKPINPKELTANLNHWFPTSGDPEPKSPTQPPSQSVEFPISDEFTFEEALERFSGNTAKLVRLLGKFRERYSNSVQELVELIDQGNTEESHRMAHSLKGVASSLGAVALADVFEGCELGIDAGKTGASLPTQKAQEKLDDFLEAIDHIMGSKTRMQLAPADIEAHLVHLRYCLDRSDLNARSLAKQISKEIKSTIYAPVFEPCARLTEQLKFSSAIDWCVAQEIPLQPELFQEPEDKCSVLVLDELANISVIADILGTEYNVRFATDQQKALDILHGATPPDLVLLDFNFVQLDEVNFCEVLKANPQTSGIPAVLMVDAMDALPLGRAIELGVVSVLTRPIHPDHLQGQLRNLFALSGHSKNLLHHLDQKSAELDRLQIVLVDIFGRIQKLKDPDLNAQIKKIKHYTVTLATATGMPTSQAELLGMAVQLRDIGNVGVPEDLLNKTGPLIDEDWTRIKQHVEIGAKIIGEHATAWTDLVRQVALTHHERIDGTGYPAGLKGEEIPFPGQIAALVDVFDALTSHRSYRKAYTFEEAVNEIKNRSGSALDPELVDIFLTILPELQKIYKGSNES